MSGPDENLSFYQISRKTVVKEKSVTIHYPHHPHYKKSLPIVEFHRNGKPPGYVCRISETITLFIPAWVTYPEAAKGCAIEQAPQIFFESLLKVAEYLKKYKY